MSGFVVDSSGEASQQGALFTKLDGFDLVYFLSSTIFAELFVVYMNSSCPGNAFYHDVNPRHI